ncbi:glutathione peroxidase [Marinospirillum alkaliphilum]|uniref:Glutathione peroxidase n=1 Tax=Marinospirillum alkaliphilum DSM 21637 TaxID=1122209 RepID=A0A1K1XQ51_9GAMM|nr:glutathione peroxidase [Marinospirillum alkaliphilum]SFX51850.1 glutathione peroxidase [Marinospirillum alkaliphilum DSM 21637]
MKKLLLLFLIPLAFSLPAQAETTQCPTLLNTTQPLLHSTESIDLCQFAGKPLLIVNTASYCGYTRQFGGLEALHQQYADRGLVVLGFPSNDFMQEARDESRTAEVCFINYGVTFNMLSPSRVSRGELNPVFAELQRQGASLPRWNFHKYLVNEEGQLVGFFGSRVEPDAPQLVGAIEAMLN